MPIVNYIYVPSVAEEIVLDTLYWLWSMDRVGTDFYFLDIMNNNMRKYDSSFTEITTPPWAYSRSDAPSGAWPDLSTVYFSSDAGDFYVPSEFEVSKINHAGSYDTEWVAPTPRATAVGPDGNVYVVCNNDPTQRATVEVYSNTGTFIRRWTPAFTGTTIGVNIAVNQNTNDVYVVISDNAAADRVDRYDSLGTLIDSRSGNEFAGGSGIFIASDDTLYITAYNDNIVYHLSEDLSTTVGTWVVNKPSDVLVYGSHVYALESNGPGVSNKVRRKPLF